MANDVTYTMYAALPIHYVYMWSWTSLTFSFMIQYSALFGVKATVNFLSLCFLEVLRERYNEGGPLSLVGNYHLIASATRSTMERVGLTRKMNSEASSYLSVSPCTGRRTILDTPPFLMKVGSAIRVIG